VLAPRCPDVVCGRAATSDSSSVHRKDADGPGDVLDTLFPCVLEGIGKFVADMVPYRAGDADPTGLGERLQPRGDVDAVAVDVTAFGDHIAEIDTDPEDDPLLLGDVGIAVEHRPLHLDSAADSIDNAGKFDEHSVAGSLYDPAVVLFDLWIDELAAMCLETLECPFLVRAHQPRITHDIGGENRRKTAADGGCGRVARRRTPVGGAAVE
jgi:hypothetical protein